MDAGTHLAWRAEEGEKGEDGDANPFPNPESAKAMPTPAHAECTNKNAAQPQRCWCQVFIAPLHLKSLPGPGRQLQPGWLGGLKEKNCCFGQRKQGEAAFTLGWASVVLLGSCGNTIPLCGHPAAPAAPAGTWTGPIQAWPGDSAVTGWVLGGPGTGRGRALG